MPRRSDVVGGVRRFVDISVPRNVAPGINAEQHAAIVYNVDDLKEVVVANKEARAAAAAEAEILLRWGQAAGLAGGAVGLAGRRWVPQLGGCGSSSRAVD